MKIFLRHMAVLLWLGTVVAAGAQPADAPPGEREAWRFVNNVVRITVPDASGGQPDEGYGFVFGARGSKLYIATADHVVHPAAHAGRPQVIFYSDQDTPVTATVDDLGLPPDKGDLAILRVQRPDGFEPHWIATVPTSELAIGARGWRIGKRESWVPASAPGTLVQHSGIWADFDTLDAPRGSSGGPIVNERGVIGMVVTDGGMAGGESQVLPIETIRGLAGDKNLPWDLVASTAVSSADEPPSAKTSYIAPGSEPYGGQPAPPPADAMTAPNYRAPSYRAPMFYGEENVDFGVYPQNTLQSALGTPTPTSIPGGRVIYTAELSNLIQAALAGRARLVLIDALQDFHMQTITHAYRMANAGQGDTGYLGEAMLRNELSATINRLGGYDASVPVVFFCGGPRCWESYNAALRAIRAGFHAVLWYRGGLQAWSAAGLPMNP